MRRFGLRKRKRDVATLRIERHCVTTVLDAMLPRF